MTAESRIQFDYTPFWAPDPAGRAPVRIALETSPPTTRSPP
jgi:hypothetical protein